MQNELPTQSKTRKWVIRFILVTSLLFLILCSVGLLSQKETMQLQFSVIEGEQTIHEEVIRDALLETVYNRKFPFFFSTSNMYLISSSLIEKVLRGSFPRIETISVSKDTSTQTVNILITERRGTMLWCGDEQSLLNESLKCQFADMRGVVFDEAPLFIGSPYVRVYRTGAQPVLLGQSVLTKDEVDAIIQIRETLERIFLVDVEAIQLTEDSQYIVYLNTPNKLLHEGTVVKILGDATLSQQLRNIELVAGNPIWKDVIAHVSDLLYIDLRFDSRVIYKPRIQHVEVSEKIIPIE